MYFSRHNVITHLLDYSVNKTFIRTLKSKKFMWFTLVPYFLYCGGIKPNLKYLRCKLLMDAYFRGEMAKIRYKVAFLQRITLMEKKERYIKWQTDRSLDTGNILYQTDYVIRLPIQLFNLCVCTLPVLHNLLHKS